MINIIKEYYYDQDLNSNVYYKKIKFCGIPIYIITIYSAQEPEKTEVERKIGFKYENENKNKEN